MANPLWKDYYVTLGTDDGIIFRIVVGENTIYTGKSHIRPGETENRIRINDICADYLRNVLPTLSLAEFNAIELPVTFSVQKFVVVMDGDPPEWVDVADVQFINDWSYDRSYNAETMGMVFPINGHIDARQWLVWTGLNVSQVTADLYYKDGTSSQVIITVTTSAGFNEDFNSDFVRAVRSAGSGTAVFNLAAWENLDRIQVNGTTYRVVSDCRRYVLYYVNAYGGWDSLLIEGNVKETDTITRYTREMEYDNRNVQNRGTQNYANEIVKSYNLVTGWLSDEEASRMHHLINSTEVYLYDIITQEMIPVVIPSTSCEYKTYKNNGCKLVNYSINVDVAHNRVRR